MTLPQWAAWLLVIAFWSAVFAAAFWWAGRVRRLPPPPRQRLRARIGKRCRDARVLASARIHRRRTSRQFADLLANAPPTWRRP